MTEMAPEQPVPDDIDGPVAEVEINFEPDDLGLKITAVLGEASIVVEHSWDGAEEAAILTQSLPNILMAVQTALNEQEAADRG